MPKENPESLREEAQRLLAEAARLEGQARDLERLGPEIGLAIAIHETTCTANHTDGCGWFYEDNQQFLKDGTTKNGYVRRAKKLIQLAQKHEIPITTEQLAKLFGLVKESSTIY